MARLPDRHGRIAQLVEQLTLNQRVLGSSPSASTIFRFFALRSSALLGAWRSLLARMLRLSLALGGSHFLELLLAHRIRHGFGRAFELALRGVAALGGQSGAGRFLLGSGFCGHCRFSRWGLTIETKDEREGFLAVKETRSCRSPRSRSIAASSAARTSNPRPTR